jgi:hypothetical protein
VPLPPLDGAFNFRDLGGLPAAGGQAVRAGVLFRSDTLQALTEQDVTRLVDALGVELIVDLRGGAEAVEQGRGLLAGASVGLRICLGILGDVAGLRVVSGWAVAACLVRRECSKR